MFKLDGTKISLTRGDTLCLQIHMERDDVTYVPAEDDVVRFALKRSEMVPGRTAYKDDEPLITKTIPNNTLQLKLDPDDTKDLKFGSYVYDIQITFSNGDVDTFIPNASFELLPEVD